MINIRLVDVLFVNTYELPYLKPYFGYDKYFDIFTNKILKKINNISYIKLFPVETGRWYITPLKESLCSLGNKGLISEEFYFFFFFRNRGFEETGENI